MESSYCGANFSGSVGPNKEIKGTLANESICITPLSIVMAKSNLFPRHVTKAGEDIFVSCSGNKEEGTNCLILSFNSLLSF